MKDKKMILIAVSVIVILIAFIVLVAFSIRDLHRANQLTSYGKVGYVSPEREGEEDLEFTEDEIIEERDIYTNSIIIKQLVNNSWNRLNAGFTSGYEADNGEYRFEGYTLNCNDNLYVKNIVFNSNYKDLVMGHLSVGASYDEAKENLGEPTFYNERLNLYGYKTGSYYAFFCDNEISVYPNTNINNSKFEELLLSYLEGTFNGNQTNFVVELRKNYPDFDAKLDGENVILTSIDRKVKITLNGNYEETEVIFYNGYANSKVEFNERFKITKERKTDLVELIEIERISKR